MTAFADEPRRRAEAATASGDHLLAFRILDEAARRADSDAPLWNSAGNAAMRAGLVDQAVDCFARGAALAPGSLEYAINEAIALGRAGRNREALEVLLPHEGVGARNTRYCSVRAASSLAWGDRAEAARWYDAALAVDPVHARANLGRARVALERAEGDAVARFEQAIAANPADPEGWLGKAHALEAAGREAEAADLAQALIDQAPQWLDALRLRSALLLAAGDGEYTQPFAAAEARLPDDPNIPMAHCETLASLDRFAEAAEVAAAARLRFPEIAEFALMEAQHAGAAGDDDRAESIWRNLDLDSPLRALTETRHRLRRGDPQAADRLCGAVLAEDPWNITAWALRGVAWRLLDDDRGEWLHGQEGLVALVPLHDAMAMLPELVTLLHGLHDGSAAPLGQSLRGGTQTRGGLFDRADPLLAMLRDAILSTLEEYRDHLPPTDLAHPLLRQRNTEWAIAGSWSVRLSGGGHHHTSHIHPKGIVSSALYLDLPADLDTDGQAGWLEIGRPPADLRLDLPPLQVIRPLAGQLALFPSTLYHGTRPFAVGRRLTVAFDVRSVTGS